MTALLLALAATPAIAADLSLNADGVNIKVTGMGDFGLTYPVLEPGDRKPLEVHPKGTHADLVYPGDTTVTLDLVGGKQVDVRFTNPKGIKSFTMKTMIGGQFSDGGTWKIGPGAVTPFPAEKPAKPHLFQGNAGSFAFGDAAGHLLRINGYPDYSYQQLTDNREWGWKIFAWQVAIPFNAGWDKHSLVITDGVAAQGSGADAIAPTKVAIQVDRFGQTTRKDFPIKVKDEADLKADVANEAAYYGSYQPLALDTWGGLPGSKDKYGLSASGFFHVEKKGDKWILVDPDGNANFHLGVCCFGYNPGDESTYIKDRHEIYEWIPPVDGEYASAFHPDAWWHKDVISFYQTNLIRKYGPERTKDQQLAVLVDRVKAVGFNAVGAFSGNSPAFTEKHFPRMDMVGVGPELPGVRGVSDPFDDATLKKMDENFGKWLPPKANDPLIIGYFFANEQAFEDIPRGVPKLDGKHAAKRKLVELLQAKYPTIAEFNTAWNLQLADFAALADKGLPVTTKAAFADMQAYTELFLDTYFKTITETFRKYDKNHLSVSNRWQPGTANNEALCRAAGKYMDVISINYYTLGVDRGFMERLYNWTGGKPQMWSEFYYTSGAEGNPSAGGLDMATQQKRGEAYRNYIEQAAHLGFVVGIEWFTLVDQAVTGRWFSKLDGERNNSGLFATTDRPYDAMWREMAKSHHDIYDVWLNGKTPFAIDDPRFTGGASKTTKTVQAGRVAPGSLTINGTTDGWPGRPPERIGSERIASGKDGKGLEAAYKVAWDAQNLYLLVNITDPTPLNNTKDGDRLWAGDGVELFIGSEKLDQPGTLLFTDHQVLLAGRADTKPGSWHVVNAATQPEIKLINVPSVDGSGYTLEAAIPWSALDVKPSEGQSLLFDLAIDDAPAGGDRTRQLMWNGGGKNSGDRSYWGRLQLVP